MPYYLFSRGSKPDHYYGDSVRVLFIIAALVMLFGLPAFNNYLNIPYIFSVIAILLLAVSAGLTSPGYRWSGVANAFISAGGFIAFDIAALQSYSLRMQHGDLFVANVALSAIFLIATYLSVKTVRGQEAEKVDII